MPKLTLGAKTTDMSQTAAQMRGQTPWGRVRTAIGFAILGVNADTWMSPQQPVDPVAQTDAWGRNKDYPVGYNLQFTPRGGDLTSFAQLRALADNCDLLRGAIETRKDQMCALKWSIGHIDQAKDKTDSNKDPRVQQITDLFKRPDQVWDWEEWMRMWLEDMLVIDAATILPRKLNNGGVYGFEVIDGATIKPLIDDAGRRPAPPSPAYQQNLKGMPAVDYSADELIYRPRNPRSHKFYGYSPVEQVMMTVNIAIRRALGQLQYYTEGNIPAAFVNVPANWTPQQIEQFQAYWDTVIEGDQAQKRKARFVPEGTKPAVVIEPALKDEFDEWLARIICFFFSLSPSALVKQVNRATAETQQETASAEGLIPTMGWVKRGMDLMIQKYLGAPDLEFRWVEEEAIDPVEQSTVLTNYQRQGNFTINQLRAKLGEDPIGPDGDVYLIYTASGAMRLEDAIKPSPEPPVGVIAPAPNAQTQQPGNDPGNPGGKNPPPKGGKPKPKQDADDQPAKKFFYAGDGDTTLYKVDTSPLTAPMQSLKDVFSPALDEVKQAALKQLAGMSKAATDDRDQSRWSDPDNWAYEFARELDTSPLSLAWDDYSDTLQAVSADGARQEVARIVQDDPTVKADADSAGFDMLDHQDPRAIEWAGNHAADILTSDGTGGELADATRNMVRETIATALKDKATNDDLAKALQDAYAFSEQRAELIARTEVTNALGAGGLAGAQAVGMKSKRWLLSNDENKCHLCISNAAQSWIAIDKPYVSGAMAPGQHPRCQCDQAYRKQPVED